MSRIPQPSRTKRGTGAGARLNLSIEYYRPPYGAGNDFGVLFGRDDQSAWELNFEGESELQNLLGKITVALGEVATEAREELADERSANRTVWLKAIGAQGLQPDEIWWDERNRDEGVDFPLRPKSVRPGDLLVVYAAGTGKIVGAMEVTGPWYEARRYPRWPYRVDTKILAARPVSQGIPLELLSGEREIGKSIRQKSHIRLSEGEASKALEALGLNGA